VVIQVAWSEKAPNVPGLFVSSSKGEEEPLFVWSVDPHSRGRIVPNAHLCGDLSKGGLTRGDVVCAINVQNVRRGARWNDDSFDAEVKRLRGAGFKTLSLSLPE
jgi:hypothetical protein